MERWRPPRRTVIINRGCFDMSDKIQTGKEGGGAPKKPAPREEPGLAESYGSFPVWLLKIIDFFTPESLISKSPPEKKKIRY